MKAITYTKFGPASKVLQLVDLDTPTPVAGEVLVRLVASGVNPSDVKVRAGGRPGVTKPPFPTIIPHSDGAGVIEAVGEGVDPDRIGQRVWIWNGQWKRAFGTAAECIALPSEQAVPLAESVSFEAGAALGIPGLTASHTVLGRGPVDRKTMLISGGAGNVGRIAVQIAAASGARVLATARGEENLAIAKAAGAEQVFDYSSEDLADQILDATGGQLVDEIVEVEFGKNIETNTRIIAENGRIVSYGSQKDMVPSLPFYPLMFKAVTIELALIYALTPGQRIRAVDGLNRLLAEGKLNLDIATVLPLEQCAEAHDMVAEGRRSGSVILSI